MIDIKGIDSSFSMVRTFGRSGNQENIIRQPGCCCDEMILFSNNPCNTRFTGNTLVATDHFPRDKLNMAMDEEVKTSAFFPEGDGFKSNTISFRRESD